MSRQADTPRPLSASDTPGVELARALAEYIERGERLAQAAGMVGDQDDLHIWRAKRNAWVKAGVARLAGTAPGTVEAFQQAVTVESPRSGWELALPDERDRVQAALSLLSHILAEADGAVKRGGTAGALTRQSSGGASNT